MLRHFASERPTVISVFLSISDTCKSDTLGTVLALEGGSYYAVFKEEYVMQCSLSLYFGGQTSPGLYRTKFTHPTLADPIVGVRGTTIPPSGVSFVLGPSMQALSMLFVRAAIRHREGQSSALPELEGVSASPAGSLSRLLKKRPESWVFDLFGADSSGRPLLQRILTVGNPHCRFPGPITVSLREKYLSPAAIQVFVDGRDISEDVAALKELTTSLEMSYVPRKDPLAGRRGTKPPEHKIISPKYGYVLTAQGE